MTAPATPQRSPALSVRRRIYWTPSSPSDDDSDDQVNEDGSSDSSESSGSESSGEPEEYESIEDEAKPEEEADACVEEIGHVEAAEAAPLESSGEGVVRRSLIGLGFDFGNALPDLPTAFAHSTTVDGDAPWLETGWFDYGALLPDYADIPTGEATPTRSAQTTGAAGAEDAEGAELADQAYAAILEQEAADWARANRWEQCKVFMHHTLWSNQAERREMELDIILRGGNITADWTQVYTCTQILTDLSTSAACHFTVHPSLDLGQTCGPLAWLVSLFGTPYFAGALQPRFLPGPQLLPADLISDATGYVADISIPAACFVFLLETPVLIPPLDTILPTSPANPLDPLGIPHGQEATPHPRDTMIDGAGIASPDLFANLGGAPLSSPPTFPLPSPPPVSKSAAANFVAESSAGPSQSGEARKRCRSMSASPRHGSASIGSQPPTFVDPSVGAGSIDGEATKSEVNHLKSMCFWDESIADFNPSPPAAKRSRPEGSGETEHGQPSGTTEASEEQSEIAQIRLAFRRDYPGAPSAHEDAVVAQVLNLRDWKPTLGKDGRWKLECAKDGKHGWRARMAYVALEDGWPAYDELFAQYGPFFIRLCDNLMYL